MASQPLDREHAHTTPHNPDKVVRNPRRGTIWTTKHHRCAHLTTRHIQRFSRRIDDLVHCLHGEVNVINSTIGSARQRPHPRQYRQSHVP